MNNLLKNSLNLEPADLMALCLGFAIVIHAAIIFGISFSPEDDPQQYDSLEVMLVQQSSEEAPEDADFLAQANLEGGGDSDEAERPATPFISPLPEQSPEIVTPSSVPVPPTPAEEQPVAEQVEKTEPAEQPAEDEEKQKEQAIDTPEEIVAITETAEIVVAKPTNEPEPEPEPQETKEPAVEKVSEPQPEAPSAATLMSRSLAMASLSAEIDRRLEEKAKRPTRKYISASTREYKYAAYMESWRSKVERIGNLNYPEAARREQISGTLVMSVALNPDGTINELTITKSSGHKVLDNAALKIVRLSAPFSPFPDNIREEVDILHIIRTWKFLHNNKFSGR